MFRFLQRFGRSSQARQRGTVLATRVRRRNHQPKCEALESRQLLSTYYIVNDASDKVLDYPGGSPTNGAIIDQWQLNGGTNQQRHTVPVSTTSSGTVLYTLVNASSGLVLGDPGFSPTSGTGIIQWQWNGGLNEQWEIQTTGTLTWIVNASSGLVLGDPWSSTSNWTQMNQSVDKDGLNEQWTLLAAGNAPAPTYYVGNVATSLVLGDPGFSTSNGTQIILWQYTGGLNEQSTYVQLSNGKYLIVNASSGLVLDPTTDPTPGIAVEQYQLNGGLNQQWVLSWISSDETYITTSTSISALYLDDPYASPFNNTPSTLDPPKVTWSQVWYLY